MTLFFIANQYSMLGKKIKVIYIISNINKSFAFEGVVNSLNPNLIDLSYILLNDQKTTLEDFLISRNIPTLRMPLRGKLYYPFLFFKLVFQILKNKPDIVHCHLFEASLFGLMASKVVGIKHRFHTRHHSNLHHVYFPKSVWYDIFINTLSTKIIVLSSPHKKLLQEKENVTGNKLELIHNGIDLNLFGQASSPEVLDMKKKYRLPEDRIIIGVISRYTEWKGIQYIIPAISRILTEVPSIHLVLANAKGDYLDSIKQLLHSIPENCYTEIEFEENIPVLFQTLDIFLHTPIGEEYESFGQTYIESLASKIPSVFTLSGVACDFIEHNKNALVVPYQNETEIYKSIKWIIENKKESQCFATQGRKDVERLFDQNVVNNKLQNLYIQSIKSSL